MTDPAEIAALATEAAVEGHGMVARPIEEWTAGVNRFDKPDEGSYRHSAVPPAA